MLLASSCCGSAGKLEDEELTGVERPLPCGVGGGGGGGGGTGPPLIGGGGGGDSLNSLILDGFGAWGILGGGRGGAPFRKKQVFQKFKFLLLLCTLNVCSHLQYYNNSY